MNWKKYFSNTILNRGKAYYNAGRVVDYAERDGEITAVVLGTREYFVELEMPGDDRLSVYCDCPHARKGNTCKHMAAVLYEWENEHGGDNQGFMDVNKIFSEPENTRQYFKMREIASECNIAERVYKEAKELVDGKELFISDFYTGYEAFRSEGRLMGIVNGSSKGSQIKDLIEINFNSDTLKSFRCRICDTMEFFGYSHFYTGRRRNICKHVTALLMLTDEYINMYSPGDKTSLGGTRLLNAFRKGRTKEIAGEVLKGNDDVVLEPRIIEDGEYYELTFKVGNGGKTYVINNLTKFFDAVDKSEEYALGKSGAIDFATESFAQDSEQFFTLIAKEVKRARAIDEKMQRRHTYYNENVETKKGIPFSGDAADTLYDLMKGGTVSFKGTRDAEHKNLKVTEATPKVEILVEKDVDGDAVRACGQLPDVIDGVKSDYFIQDGILSTLSGEDLELMLPFSDVSSRRGNIFEVFIGVQKAREFYYEILPRLQENRIFEVDVYDVEEIEAMLGPQAEVSFYLDAQDGSILCRAEAAYGDELFDIRPVTDADLPMDPVRDIYKEKEIRELLAGYFPAFSAAENSYYLDDDGDKRFDLLKAGIVRMMAEGDVSSTDAFSRIRIRRRPVVQVGVRMESDLLNLDILSDDIDKSELGDILASFKKKKTYHRLKNGEFIDLEGNETIGSLVEMMDSLGAAPKDLEKGKIQLPTYRALYLDEMLKDHEELVKSRNRVFRGMVRDFKSVDDSDFEVPVSLENILRPYQEYGYKWLQTLKMAGFGGILADDMGLGKTIQVLAMLLAEKEDKGSVTSLVVCPASLVYNWLDEAEKFTPDLDAAVVAGTKSQRRKLIEEYEDHDILITSYDLLKRDIELYEEKKFDFQFIDEAQYIKNQSSAAAKTVKLVSASHKFALTGTPIENRLSELWSIFDYLMPGFLYGYERFRKQFENPIAKQKDETATEMLKKMVAPFLLRRRKENVLKDLPDKTEEVRRSELEGEQRKLYDAQVMKIRKMIDSKEEDFASSKIQILAELTKIRQICCDPSLLFDDFAGDSAKRQACMQLISSAAEGGHKMLLFSQFTSMLAILEDDLKNEGIQFYKITGETPKEERIRLVRSFNQDETPVFLISLKAGGTGLNLTGADMVIHYDPWWNTAAQDQATDRAHRIGQTKNVTVYKLIAKDTIEEKILKIQETKKELADAILTGETRSLGAMSKDELMELLSR